MTPRLLRLVYAFEFLIAIVAIFTAWSEIGGQGALDLMHWGWKLGLSVALAGSMVAYTAAVVSDERLWTLRSLRWLAAIALVTVVIGVITYYYALQVDAGQSDETGTISLALPAAFAFAIS
jgi:Kef-type K+ transport system membrane component KefB